MRTAIATSLGLLMGLLMAWSMNCTPVYLAILDSPILSLAYAIVHLPAWGIFALWGFLGLPPHGCDGFAMIPASVIIQWLTLGLVCGMFWQKKYRKKRSANQTSEQTLSVSGK